MPRSSSSARRWLISAVRSEISRARARCSAWTSDCASLFTGTKRIVGRVAAAAIASALTARGEHAPEVMRAAARLHRYHAARQALDKPGNRLPTHPSAQDHRPHSVQPD